MFIRVILFVLTTSRVTGNVTDALEIGYLFQNKSLSRDDRMSESYNETT